MDIDLSIMYGKSMAVHFTSKEQATIFYEEMKTKFPEKTRSWYGAFWVDYNSVCYYPRFHQGDHNMTHGSLSTYVDMGVKIIEFEDLLVCRSDFGDITEHGNILDLFGAEGF